MNIRWGRALVLVTTAAATVSMAAGPAGAEGTETDTTDYVRKSAEVRITRVVNNPDGNDLAYGGGEYIRLTNYDDVAVSLEGWELSDEYNYFIPIPAGYVIRPGDSLKVFSGSGDNTGHRYFARLGSPIWDDDHDTVRLSAFDATGVDTWRY